MARVDYESAWDPGGDAWLSGFIDGEGCLSIYEDRRRGTYAPVFDLAVRADDAAVLIACAEAIGGRVTFAAKNGGTPQARWNVTKRADLARLASYLRRYPLRAKKARDCAIWLEAVRIYLAARRARQVAEELAVLQAALRAGRAYEPPEALPAPLRAVS